jgi:cytochrome c oxidase subunit 1
MSATSIDHSPSHASAEHGHHDNYLVAKKGLSSWLWTVDHKRLGIMYLASVILFFIVGGLAAIAVRSELMNPAKDFMDADAYNRMFTLHGAVMVFLVIIPSIPASLGNFVLPLMPSPS